MKKLFLMFGVLIFILLSCQPKVSPPEGYHYVGTIESIKFIEKDVFLELNNRLVIENPNTLVPFVEDSIYSDKYGQNYFIVPK